MAPRHPKRPRDPNQFGKLIVDLSTGSVEEESSPAETPATEFARSGGLKGGRARADRLSPERAPKSPSGPRPMPATYGLGLRAETKLVPSWRIGDRSSETAIAFADDLAKRLASRVQITSDGHKAYLEAIEGAFGGDVDYGMLIKVYGPAPEGQRRYSPAEKKQL